MSCPTFDELPPPPHAHWGWSWTANPARATVPRPTPLSPSDSWPKITVVTPVYNQCRFIEATIRSVLLQGYPNLEYIVIDGGSTDGTVAIIERYAPWLAYWCSERDRGQSHALNKGFARATGDWFAWLNADDLYLPNALWRVALAAQAAPTSEWIIGRLCMLDEALTGLPSVMVPSPPTAIDNQAMWQGHLWLAQVCFRSSGLYRPQPSSFWSRHAHQLAGELDETLHYAMDLDHWGKLTYQGLIPTLLLEQLALFRTHGDQKSARGELRFMQDELVIVDKWLAKVTGTERQILRAYRRWLANHIRWQWLMQNRTLRNAWSKVGQRALATHLARPLWRHLQKRRPSWMFYHQ